MVVDRAAAALERAARRAAIAVEEDVASAAAADGPPAKVSKTDQALINAKEKSRQRRAIAVSLSSASTEPGTLEEARGMAKAAVAAAKADALRTPPPKARVPIDQDSGPKLDPAVQSVQIMRTGHRRQHVEVAGAGGEQPAKIPRTSEAPVVPAKSVPAATKAAASKAGRAPPTAPAKAKAVPVAQPVPSKPAAPPQAAKAVPTPRPPAPAPAKAKAVPVAQPAPPLAAKAVPTPAAKAKAIKIENSTLDCNQSQAVLASLRRQSTENLGTPAHESTAPVKPADCPGDEPHESEPHEADGDTRLDPTVDEESLRMKREAHARFMSKEMATVVRREMKPHREKLSELRDVLEQEVAKAKESGIAAHAGSQHLGRKSGHNDSRDFWRFTDIPVAMREVSVPVKDSKAPGKFRHEKQLMLYPHDIIAYVFNVAKLEIEQQRVDDYWNHHLACRSPFASEDSKGKIPLGLYGDKAQLQTKYRVESIFCLFLSFPLFRPRSIRYSRFLLWSCDVALLYKSRTVNTILRKLAWSFNYLATGRYPTSGPGGVALSRVDQNRAGSQVTLQFHKFQVTEYRGDWEHHKSLWQLTCSWNGIETCHRCTARSKGNAGLLYWNLDQNARWRSEEFDTNDFINNRLPESHICPLINVHAFHPSCIRWCTMHILNLGLVFGLNGGALCLLAERVGHFGPGSFQDQLDRAYKDFVAYCRRHRLHHSQPPFKEKHVKMKTGEILLLAKAWNGRVLVDWLASTLREVAPNHPGFDGGILETACVALQLSDILRLCFLFSTTSFKTC
ncbi:unnamed protein product [Durusdinium trenchii]|uniref:Uncharacterized protein n=1 Tax=Durusdinium trenchii TaxID=1381693 RepID=A0ABP0PCY3_9DINO